MQSIHRLALISSLLFVLPSAALADDDAEAATTTSNRLDMLKPSSRPMFATFSIAPALKLSNSITQVKLAQTFGYHLSGDGTGLAFGGEIQESFGSSVFVLQVGPKAWYDIPIAEDLGIYIAPTAMIGLAYASTSFGGSDAGFNMQFGAEAKVILNDRALIFFRPFNLDIAIGDNTAVRWDLVFGAGATF